MCKSKLDSLMFFVNLFFSTIEIDDAFEDAFHVFWGLQWLSPPLRCHQCLPWDSHCIFDFLAAFRRICSLLYTRERRFNRFSLRNQATMAKSVFVVRMCLQCASGLLKNVIIWSQSRSRAWHGVRAGITGQWGALYDSRCGFASSSDDRTAQTCAPDQTTTVKAVMERNCVGTRNLASPAANAHDISQL